MSTRNKAIIVLVVIGAVCAVAIGVTVSGGPQGDSSSSKGGWMESLSNVVAAHTLIAGQDLQPAAKPPGFFANRTFSVPVNVPCKVTVVAATGGVQRTIELGVDGPNAAKILWEPNPDPGVPLSDPPKPRPIVLSATSHNPLRISVMKAGGTLTLTGTAGAGRPAVAVVHLR